MSFAILDFETTGRFSKFDRVLEIGLVILNSDLEVEAEFETLVNPSRDSGPQHVHGIQSAWLLGAPAFEEIASAFAQLLRGRIVIAHNARFDAGFAESEFRRLDSTFSLDWSGDGGLPAGFACTKRLSRHFFGTQAQSLGWLADAFDISNERPHAAIHDARVTAEVFISMFERSALVRDEVSRAGRHADPSIGSRQFKCVTRPTESSQNRSGIEKVVDSLPPTSSSSNLSDFIELLMASVLDLQLSEHQISDLASLANEMHLGQDQVNEAKIKVFEGISAHYWTNKSLSPFEREALQKIGKVLNIEQAIIEEALVKPHLFAEIPDLRVLNAQTFLLTGFATERKRELSMQLETLGKSVVSNFSKKVDVVIANDPDTQSGKAKSARLASIPVLGEAFVNYITDRAEHI